ncbi:MAG: hypothetical protein M3042_09865 [Actinomycetota bacterium]|nr:hypothetical protein [Actinomycetota bacterium]
MQRMRVLAQSAVAAVALLGLSGCVKLDMDLKVRANSRVDGTVIIAVDKRILDVAGQSQTDFRKQLESQGPFSGSDRPSQGSFSQHPYQADGRVGETYTFSGVPLAQFAGRNSGLKISRRGDRFFVSGLLDLTGGSSNNLQQQEIARRLAASAQTRIRITFPGEVLHSNGKIDGRSVTWHPKLGEKTPLTAEARTTAIFPILFAVAGGVGALLLVAAAVVLMLFLRRRRVAAAVPAAADYPADPGYPAGDGASAPPRGSPPHATQPLPVIDPDPPAPGSSWGSAGQG